MKLTRSHLLTIVYALFTMLYTVYIGEHGASFGSRKGDDWWYFFKFLFFGGYLFFIFQGILLHSKNWGVLLLLPLVIMPMAVLAGVLLLLLLRWGGGTLFDRDEAGMIALSLIFIIMSFLALRFISGGKAKRKVKK